MIRHRLTTRLGCYDTPVAFTLTPLLRSRTMTVANITKRQEIENTIHQCGIDCVNLIAAAVKKVKENGGESDDAESRILELITDE